MNNNDPSNPEKHLQDLLAASENYLEKVNKDAKDLLQEREKEAEQIKKIIGQQPDAFESVYKSYTRAMEQRNKTSSSSPHKETFQDLSQDVGKKVGEVTSRIVAGLSRLGQMIEDKVVGTDSPLPSPEAAAAKAPLKDTSSAAQTVPKQQTTPPSSVKKTSTPAETFVSPKILERMSALLEKMSQDPVEATEENSVSSFDRLSRLSSSIRSAWVPLLSQGAAGKPSGHRHLNEWEKIVKDIASECQQWPFEQSQTWNKWAQERLEEITVLHTWFDVSTAPEVTSATVLTVPMAFKGKGIIPKAPRSVPQNITADLQNCADYWEFVSSRKSKFHWVNTPAKHAFDECQSALEKWTAPSPEAQEWKEKSLERYSILEGRLTLRADTRENVAPTSKKNQP